MNKLSLVAGLGLLLLITGCVELPGADSTGTKRYMLGSAETVASSCATPGASLDLSIMKVNAGLDTDRIARRDADTGELSYLKGVRWVDTASVMLEQRLATDLECGGYTVVSSHHRRLSHDQLVCEIRALNIVSDANGDRAEVGLSCIYSKAGDGEELALKSTHQSKLRKWTADDAVAAVSEAYKMVFKDMLNKLS